MAWLGLQPPMLPAADPIADQSAGSATAKDLTETGPSPNARRTMGRPGWMVRTWVDPGSAPQTIVRTSRVESRSCQAENTASAWVASYL
jgi:hypothetical protein